MPKTRFQAVVFTALTAFFMVCLMTLYNLVRSSGAFTNGSFLSALQSMWPEYAVIFLCAFFISSPLARKCA